MNVQFLESEAKRLIGGARIEIKPYQDAVNKALDVSIVPVIGGELRFIRIPATSGEGVIVEYLKKIQQNLLKLQRSGAFGINPIKEEIDQNVIDKAVENRLNPVISENQTDNLEKFGEPVKSVKLECKCGYSTPYPGILAIHRKKCTTSKIIQPVSSCAKAINEPGIYDL